MKSREEFGYSETIADTADSDRELLPQREKETATFGRNFIPRRSRFLLYIRVGYKRSSRLFCQDMHLRTRSIILPIVCRERSEAQITSTDRLSKKCFLEFLIR